jgi:putative aminopeptidase FrvX
MHTDVADHPDLSLFAELLAVPSPSGCEQRTAQLIREKLDAWGCDHRTDGAGNVIVHLAGRHPDGPVSCLAAHIDEIGMVVTSIEPDGSLHVDCLGGLLPWKLGEGPLEIIGDKDTIVGVLSMGSAHVASAGTQPISWNDVRILTGLPPSDLKSAGVRPGTAAVRARGLCGPVLFGESDDPLVAAWTFDDRMGAVALLRLLQAMKRDSLKPRYATIAAFTVHEEDGGQGAKVLAQAERPEVFVALDGCPMPPGAPLALDGRPGIWSKDRLTSYDQGLVRDLCQAAERAGTALQPVVYDSTTSDAGMVASVGAAARVACFGHVRESSHGYEVARLSVFDNVFKTLVEFVTGW